MGVLILTNSFKKGYLSHPKVFQFNLDTPYILRKLYHRIKDKYKKNHNLPFANLTFESIAEFKCLSVKNLEMEE